MTDLATTIAPAPDSAADEERASRLIAQGVSLGYNDRVVVSDLDVAVPTGKVSVIVGANACGKSTLLRALARLLKPRVGSVLLDGQVITRMRTREVAKVLGLLPQSPTAPEGLSVGDLVARGRNPHQSWWQQWSETDEAAVADALHATRTLHLAERAVDELSGGQRQRAWIAMALAQGTDLLLLDEPTTYLDLAHQVDILDLVAELNARDGRTVVMVLHDLNSACRYADHIIAMHDGHIVAEGTPAGVVTEELIRRVFDLDARIITDPVSGTPLVIPVSSRHCDAT